jgi:hypothetical protein
VIHERPGLIEELRWRPPHFGTPAAENDPVREIVFTFYGNHLFLIAVDYDRNRTEGLTNADLIDALATRYGAPVLASRAPWLLGPATDPDAETVVARWADDGTSLTLVRTTYPTGLRLLITSKRVAAEAGQARQDALQQDARDAPLRAVEQRKRVEEDARLAREKARVVNKSGFRP